MDCHIDCSDIFGYILSYFCNSHTLKESPQPFVCKISIRPRLVLAPPKNRLQVCISVRSLARKIISLANCVGNVSRLMTRNLFSVINSVMAFFRSPFI